VKGPSILVAGVVMALAVFAAGCGGDDEAPVAVPDNGGAVVSPGGPGGGLVPLNKFLEFDGRRFMLTLELNEAMVGDGEFTAVGEATAADIDLGSKITVYERAGDPEAVYTLSPATEDDGALWLRWAKS
jgi:hypothetical protein